MIFNYICGIGIPHKNRIVRGENGLYTIFEDGDEHGFIKVASADLKTKLLFRMRDGLFVGLTYSGEVQRKADLCLPSFSDGTLAVDVNGRFLTDKCVYLDFHDGNVLYDEARNVVLFGNFSKDYFTVRVCKNVYVSMTNAGTTGGIFVELTE
ncbi:MAG: hypothetical protein K2L72_03285 [Clostridia bacterium]|nr:hypothetical protein [Clostridia bacterium]